jgi:FAD/FMN-containing dehydrogenase/Fe-S oxidoreductase
MSLTERSLPVVARVGQSPEMSRGLAEFHETLAKTVSGEVRVDRLSRAIYSTDASVYQIVPSCVVLPRTEADVLSVVRACARFGVPLTARGGGTSQAGQSIGAGVILDTSKYFNEILGIDPPARTARVRPGCVLDDLNRRASPHGLKFAPDISTASRATIGGMIANNSSGARSVVYGKTGDHVLGLKVVLADGSVVETGPLDAAGLEAKCSQPGIEGEGYRAVRRLAFECAHEIEARYPKILRCVGGYDLTTFRPGEGESFDLSKLFLGSEGTLGVVVEATLRLVELPKARAVVVAQFDDLLVALAATPAVLSHRPAAVEVIDRYVLDSTKLNPEAARLRDFLHGDPGAILIIELYGDNSDELAPRLDALEAGLHRGFPSVHLLRATEIAAQARIWKLRELALGLSMAEKGDAKAISFVEDTAVAPEHLRDYIAKFLQVVARHGTKAGVYAHASVGCLHVRPVIDLKTVAGVNAFEAIANDVSELVLKYGGAISGEHGDGLVRSPFQEKMYGPALYQAFREVKQAFDPLGVLNPGKIVDAPPMTSNLRFGPRYVTPDVPTTFDFSADGGMLRAAELCAGVGACRKKAEGTMCPSYQATRDERDSTRGRANALRLAITHQAELRGLTDPALLDVLDLCLECKACKAECPTNVDMARLKAEVLHQFYREKGLPWRNRVFGHVEHLSRWGSRLAPLSNWAARGALGRWLNERLLGIDRRRVPPAFARRTLRDRLRSSPLLAASADQPSSGRPVLLFPDTFTNYHEPEVGVAAAELLSMAGCAVSIGPNDLRCCARPQISSGLLDEAVENARHNVALLHKWAVRGRVITACEPSCVLTIKDDYPALLRGADRARAETVAAACRTFEELLESALRDAEDGDRTRLTFRAGPGRVLVQPHCHQRALVGPGPLLKLLAHVPGTKVVDLDAGCCGMAGAFGYEAEHYEVSRLVGEQRLFPAVRAAAAETETVVIAPGISCRLQIDHFTGRTAAHPAVFLRGVTSENSS